jgi:pyrimidine operon attenuation protein/uracil phosphoribosyltransferase
MPVKRLGHDAHPQDVIVNRGHREVRIGAPYIGRRLRKINENLAALACLRVTMRSERRAWLLCLIDGRPG